MRPEMSKPAAAAMARLTLQAGLATPAALVELAQTCRQLGALAEARALVSAACRSPADAPETARALSDVFEEQPMRAHEPSEGARPAPFVRRSDVLPDEALEIIRSETAARVGEFSSSEISDGAYEGVDLTLRRSLFLKNPAGFRELILPAVRALVMTQTVQAALGVSTLSEEDVELQLTCHNDGAFFKPHTDANAVHHTARRVSFVYYFSFPPPRFSGGDLILFDSVPGGERYASGLYTRVEPVSNSLILFASSWVHEVGVVSCPGGNALSGRFSLNGWFRDAVR